MFCCDFWDVSSMSRYTEPSYFSTFAHKRKASGRYALISERRRVNGTRLPVLHLSSRTAISLSDNHSSSCSCQLLQRKLPSPFKFSLSGCRGWPVGDPRASGRSDVSRDEPVTPAEQVRVPPEGASNSFLLRAAERPFVSSHNWRLHCGWPSSFQVQKNWSERAKFICTETWR